MASNLQRPQAIKKPFANSGDKNTIPVADTGTQRASLDEGFPQITGIPVSEGGIPPERKDMNALGYLTTSQYFYLQCGGRFTFDPDVSTAIGGYPAGAVLEYTDVNAGLSYAVISVINNNTYNFVSTPSYIDGSKWKKAFSEDLSNYVDRSTNQTVGGQKTFTESIRYKGSTALSYNSIHGSAVKGTTPTSNVNSTFSFLDSTFSGSYNATISRTQYGYDPGGKTFAKLQAFKPTSASTQLGTIAVYYPSTGDPYTEAPTPANGDNSTKISTTEWVNNNSVMLSGNQTIAGTKTFTSNINQQLVNPTYIARHPDLEKGTTPSSTGALFVGLYDKNGGSTGRLAGYLGEYNTAGYIRSSLLAYTPTSGVTNYSYLSMITNTSDCYARLINASGITNKSISKVSSSTTDDYIPTMGWVNNPACSTNVVHRSDDETIAGLKKFTKQVTKTTSSATTDTIFVNKNTAITKGTAPSGNVESRWRLTDSSTGDGNSALIGGVAFGYSTSIRTNAILQVGKPEAGSTETASMGIYYPATGDAYTYAPTPATSDNSTKIATTAYVQANLSSYALDNSVVKLTGNQNIAGNKTFTNDITINKATPIFELKNTNYTKGTAPDDNRDSYLKWIDSSGAVYGSILNRVSSNLNNVVRFQAFKQSANSNAYTTFGVNYSADGKYYLSFSAINTDSGDKNYSLTKSSTSTTDTTIPCMGWVNSRITDVLNDLLGSLYPVGSIYIGTQSTCPLSTLISGSTWTLVSSGKALWTGDGTNGNTTINAGLPNVTGYFDYAIGSYHDVGLKGKSGAFTNSTATRTISSYRGYDDSVDSTTKAARIEFDASSSDAIYGGSSTVQPPAYVVNVWRRTA